MSYAYQNATRSGNEAVFIRVQPGVDGSAATIRAKSAAFTPAPGQRVDMVNATVRLVSPVTIVNGDVSFQVDESVEIRFNARKGATTVPDSLTEAMRILTECLNKYNLTVGLVPPSEARFELE